MWLGKIAIIMYVFSTALLFSGYMMEEALAVDLFPDSFTYDNLEALASKNDVDESITAELIFGDFIAGVNVLFGILTGDTISSAMGAIPGFDSNWQLLSRIIFTLSSAFLWIFVVTGRSV